MNPEEVRLDEFDEVEWFDICRKIKPDLTQEEFDAMWDSFQERKAAGQIGPKH